MYNSRLRINHKEIAYRKISEDFYIIFHLRSQKAFILNNVASKIWESLFFPATLGNIIDSLSQMYLETDIEILKKDITNFINQLNDNGFITKDGLSFHIRIQKENNWENLLLDNAIRELADKKNLCLNVICEITQKCNLHCVHCYIPKQSDNELNLPNLHKIFSDLPEMGCISLTITGGEPFIRNDILDVLKIARSYNFAISLLTNGSLLSSDIIERLEELQLLNIGVTIYGTNEDTYGKISMRGNIFKKIMDNLELLVKKGLPVSLRFMLMRENLHKVDDFLSLCENLNLTPKIDFRIFPKFNGNMEPLKHRLEIDKITQLIEENKIKRPSGVVCSPCSYSCRIAADGEVYPCSTLNISIGNILRQKFKNIWVSEKANFFRNQALIPSECMDCYLHKNKNCLNCPGVALLEEKSFKKSSRFLCALSKKLFAK